MSNTKGAPIKVSPLAGKPAPPAMLVDVPRLVTAYYAGVPDVSVQEQRVAFGTSGHRGSALVNTFNEWHVLPISQAICDCRKGQGIGGPLFLGIELDHKRNTKNAPLTSPDAGRVKVRVIRTDEELMIARSVMRVLKLGSIRGT